MTQQKSINLALQGGGAHGAYTWGVLDALLEDGRFDIEGISATSAGAMNAAALAYGKSSGGAERAREVLHDFWHEIARVGALYSPVKRSATEFVNAMNPFTQDWGMDNSMSFALFEAMTRSVSPYQFNPLNINPLREVLERSLDFDEIHACECVKLFISATDVQSGTSKVFHNQDVTIDVLTASAALPFLFQAVEINGRHYWDGGYMGNPALHPLFYHARSRDILLVHVNPIVREDVPQKAYEIHNRINEITFNSTLLKELRAIDFVKRLIDEDMLKDEYKERYKNILIHAIRSDETLCDLSIASKFDTSWHFLCYLRDKGREQAQSWLAENFKHIGKKDTVDIRRDYLAL